MRPKKNNRKRRAMPRKTRFNDYQIRCIHKQLNDKKYPTYASLARDLGVSIDCIKRNVAHMRTHRKLPIEMSRTLGKVGLYYSRPVTEDMRDPLTREQLMYWLIIKHAMAQLPGIPEEMQIKLDHIAEFVDPATMELLDEMQDMFWFKPFAPEPVNMDLVYQLADARRRRRVVDMEYTKLLATSADSKTIAPLGLALINWCWYIAGMDMSNGKHKTYMLSRMNDVTISDDKFKMPKDFSTKEHFKGALIVLGGVENHKVVLEYDMWGAAFHRTRHFADDQKIDELPGGGIRLTFHVAALEEVEAALVGYWRHHVRVIEPPALIERMRNYGEFLSKTYGRPNASPTLAAGSAAGIQPTA